MDRKDARLIVGKRRVMLAGGGPGHLPFEELEHGIYGFETHVFSFHPSRWEGEYISREMLFADPTLMDGMDLCLLVTEWDFEDRQDVEATIMYAHEHNIIIGGDANGPYYSNILDIPKGVLDQRRRLDFTMHPAGDINTKATMEKLYGIPYYDYPAPILMDRYLTERDSFIKRFAWDVPKGTEDCFILGHWLGIENLVTLKVAEIFEIPLIVNLYSETLPPRPWLVSRGGIEKLQHVKYIPNLDNGQWFYLLSQCRGVFHLSNRPTAGRPALYAALYEKISLQTEAAWQWRLYPEMVLRPDHTAGVDWENKAAFAETLMPEVQERLRSISVESSQEHFEAFLAEHGWG